MTSPSNNIEERIEVVLPGRVAPEGLVVRRVPLQPSKPRNVVLKMEATGVSFAEQQMRRGKYYDQPAFPFVPGYDLVGTVRTVGEGVDSDLVGHRLAAITKVGTWASSVEVNVLDLMLIADEFDPVQLEALTVNGITAWQMLHQVAAVGVGSTIVVLGANGGVGSTLVQLARHAGIRVIGTASTRHHELVRKLGAEPVDYRSSVMYERIRELAPDGVDAVFDHVGGANLARSWSLVRRGGILVSYGTASTKNDAGSSQLPILALFGRLILWNLLPNGKRTHFYNLWAGRRRAERFRADKNKALSSVVKLLASGDLTPNIAARFPLTEASEAMSLAESGTLAGKVILLPVSLT